MLAALVAPAAVDDSRQALAGRGHGAGARAFAASFPAALTRPSRLLHHQPVLAAVAPETNEKLPSARLFYYNVAKKTRALQRAKKNLAINADFLQWLKDKGWEQRYEIAVSSGTNSCSRATNISCVVESILDSWDGGFYDMVNCKKLSRPLAVSDCTLLVANIRRLLDDSRREAVEIQQQRSGILWSEDEACKGYIMANEMGSDEALRPTKRAKPLIALPDNGSVGIATVTKATQAISITSAPACTVDVTPPTDLNDPMFYFHVLGHDYPSRDVNAAFVQWLESDGWVKRYSDLVLLDNQKGKHIHFNFSLVIDAWTGAFFDVTNRIRIEPPLDPLSRDYKAIKIGVRRLMHVLKRASTCAGTGESGEVAEAGRAISDRQAGNGSTIAAEAELVAGDALRPTKRLKTSQLVAQPDNGSLGIFAATSLISSPEAISITAVPACAVDDYPPVDLVGPVFYFHFLSQGGPSRDANGVFIQWLESDGWIDKYSKSLVVPDQNGKNTLFDFGSLIDAWAGVFFDVTKRTRFEHPLDPLSFEYKMIKNGVRRVMRELKRGSNSAKTCALEEGEVEDTLQAAYSEVLLPRPIGSTVVTRGYQSAKAVTTTVSPAPPLSSNHSLSQPPFRDQSCQCREQSAGDTCAPNVSNITTSHSGEVNAQDMNKDTQQQKPPTKAGGGDAAVDPCGGARDTHDKVLARKMSSESALSSLPILCEEAVAARDGIPERKRKRVQLRARDLKMTQTVCQDIVVHHFVETSSEDGTSLETAPVAVVNDLPQASSAAIISNDVTEQLATRSDRMIYYNVPRKGGQERSAVRNAAFIDWLTSEGWLGIYLDALRNRRPAKMVVKSVIAAWDGGFLDLTSQTVSRPPLDPSSPLYARISVSVLRLIGNLKHIATTSQICAPAGARARKDQKSSALCKPEPSAGVRQHAEMPKPVTSARVTIHRAAAKTSQGCASAKSFMQMDTSAAPSRRHTRSAAVAIGGIYTVSDEREDNQIMIGPHFQCELPPCRGNLFKSESAEDYATCIWDPVKAERAKARGQCIDSFLSLGESSLAGHAQKLEVLHKCDYNVEAAIELSEALAVETLELPVELINDVDAEANGWAG